MFLLHQAQEAQPGSKPGHLIFHAKHGLKLLHGKSPYPFFLPSISVFPELTHLHPLFTLSRLNRLSRAYLDALFQPQLSLKLLSFVKPFISHESFFLQVSIFSMRLMFLFFFAFASFCFYLFSYFSLLRSFLANLRLFMLFSHFLCFFASLLATFFHFYFYFCIFH
jgi:hypothetical protein